MLFLFWMSSFINPSIIKGRAKNKGKQAVEAILVLESTMALIKIISAVGNYTCCRDDLDVAELSSSARCSSTLFTS